MHEARSAARAARRRDFAAIGCATCGSRARNASGRVARLKLDGLQPGRDLRSGSARGGGADAGWQHIKSTAFDLRREGESYRFSGHGSGHGVGMCVIGSARLAERGETRRRDPRAIFSRPGDLDDQGLPGVRLRSDASGPSEPPPAVRGRRQRGQPRRQMPCRRCWCRCRTMTRASVRRSARRRFARATNWRARSASRRRRVTLRFHPTTDDYERVTGQPWFTSGAVVHNELHLLPLAVLRDRGVLDRTIRHELVHLMTDAALGNARRVGARGRGDLFRRRADDSRRAEAASGVQARAARRRVPKTTSCCTRCRSARSATPTRERARASRSRSRRANVAGRE